MTLRSPVRSLCRAGTAALVVACAGLVAPPAALAEEAAPVVELNPPDLRLALLATENFFGASSASTDAASALAAAAAATETADASGTATVASHGGADDVEVEYGGTVVVTLPALVDASAAEVSLDVLDPVDADADPRTYSTDPVAVDPLVVADLGGNEFEVTLPADDATFGPEAVLTFDGLTATEPGIAEVWPLDYDLVFTGTGVSAVPLEPIVSLGDTRHCGSASVGATECPPTEVRAGESFDLTVPSTSLLRTLGFGRLDNAEVAFGGLSSSADDELYSGADAGLLTLHGADSATVNLPADMSAGSYLGVVMEGDPASGGMTTTMFRIDVAAARNPGLHSDTGWVDDVRDASPGSTAAVAGVAMLIVAGVITVVAVAPRRRRSAEG